MEVPDLDLGGITRAIRGLKVTQPKMRPEEEVLWAKRANRLQGIRAVGGRIYITNRRLFGPNNLDAAFRGVQWSAPLSEIESVDVKGPIRLVHVQLTGDRTERFVVRPALKQADLIRAAAEAAR